MYNQVENHCPNMKDNDHNKKLGITQGAKINASKTVSMSQMDKEHSIYKKRKQCDKKNHLEKRILKTWYRNKNTTRLEDKVGDTLIK